MNQIYENFVLENQIENILLTQIDMNRFLTPDYSLAENAGMTKKVHAYKAVGDVEELSMGQGNTQDIETTLTEKTYTVGTTQGRFTYFDEEAMTDPFAINAGVQGLADTMTNDLTKKAIKAMEGATLSVTTSSWSVDDIIDAIALYPYEDEAGLFLLINPAQKADFRKALGEELKYSEGFARTGYIGTIMGVPVYVSKAVPEDTAFLGSPKAVKCFVKKGVEVEQDRDPNTRKNEVYARKVMLVALVDETRMIKIEKA